MGLCSVTFEEIKILAQKSDSRHADNCWLCLSWSVNNIPSFKAIPLQGQHGSTALWTGDIVKDVSDSIPCGDSDTVTLAYNFVNLSAVDPGRQLEVAVDFSQKLAKLVAKTYLDIAQEMLRHAPRYIPLLPVIGELIGIGASAAIARYKDRAVELIDVIFDDLLEPLLREIIDVITILLGGRPNCNGIMAADTYFFLPQVPGPPVAESRQQTYDGLQNNSSCGAPPKLSIDARFSRSFDATLIPPDWDNSQNEPSKVALRSFQFMDKEGKAAGFAGAIPTFSEEIRGRDHFELALLINLEAAERREVPIDQLGNPAPDDFFANIKIAQAYAAQHGFTGAVPTFMQREADIPNIYVGDILDGRRIEPATRRGIITEILLLRPEFTEWQDVSDEELGNPAVDDIDARFQATQAYAIAHGFAGGIPNFFHANTMIFSDTVGDINDPVRHSQSRPGIVFGTILFRTNAAVARQIYRSSDPA